MLGFRIVLVVLLMQRRTQLSRTCANVVAVLSGDCISFEIQNENLENIVFVKHISISFMNSSYVSKIVQLLCRFNFSWK